MESMVSFVEALTSSGPPRGGWPLTSCSCLMVPGFWLSTLSTMAEEKGDHRAHKPPSSGGWTQMIQQMETANDGSETTA